MHDIISDLIYSHDRVGGFSSSRSGAARPNQPIDINPTCNGWVVERTGQRCVLAYNHDGKHAPDESQEPRSEQAVDEGALTFIESIGLLAEGETRIGWRGWLPWNLRKALRNIANNTAVFLDVRANVTHK